MNILWTFRRDWRIWAIFLITCITPLAHSYGAEGERAKRVLMLSTGSRFSIGFPIVEQNAVDKLRQLYPGELELYSEYLDIIRFPSARYERIFRDYLQDKYADDVPDLIILTYVGNLKVGAALLERIFPGVPVVVAGLTEEELPDGSLGSRVTGIAQRSDPTGTLETMLRLQPEIRRIVVIGGAAEVDRQVLSRARQAVRSLGERVEAEIWGTRSLPDILKAVTSLPPQTAILFTRMYRDGAGGATMSTNVAQSVAKVSNAPVYVMSDPMLGTGAVGGSVVDVPSLGMRLGEMAYRVLNGAEPSSMPFQTLAQGVPTFDWRVLKRRGIPDSRLPPGSVVRFKPQSMWDQYRWYIVGALAIILLQTAMIADLLLHRRRRRRAEAELTQSRQLMELATEAGGIGLWVRDVVRGDLWANPRVHSLFRFDKDEVLEEDVLARVHSDDRARVLAVVESAQEGGTSFEVEFRTSERTAIPDRWIAARGQFVRDAQGQVLRRMGTLIDITERKQAEERLRESEDNFRRLVETTAAVMWQAEIETWEFTYVGPQAVKLLGYPLEQWYEKDFWVSHIHPDDREQAVNTCLRMSKSAEEFDLEYRMIRSSGESVWVHDFVNCQHRDGKPFRLRGLMLDVTERKQSEQALRESEDRFRTMANSAPVMIWMSGRDKGCIFFNKGWLDFTGRKLEQELGEGWADGVHPDEVERCLDVYTASFDARREFSIEYRLRRYDGEYRWIFDNGVPRFERDGAFLGYIGTATDITERKRAEEKFRLAVEASPSAMVMADGQGRIVLVNVQAETLFGYAREELIGQFVEILVPELFRDPHPGNRAAFLAQPAPAGPGRELWARRKDGSVFSVEVGVNPIKTDEGPIVLTSIVDISARKQAEDTLEKERKFLRQVIDIDPNFIFAKDRHGRFTLANRAVAEAYGTTVENLIGRTDADFNSKAEEVENFHIMDLQVIDTLQEQFIAEERITDAAGRIRWLQTVKRPIIDKDGLATQVLGSSTDISQRKATELELGQQREELAHLTRVSNMGELAASLAHELNQPLTAILSNAQAGQRFLSNEQIDVQELREILRDIVEDNNRASEVIRRMRAMIRKDPLEFNSVNLPSIAHEIISLVHSDAVLRNVRVSLDVGRDLQAVRGDKIQLQQVFLNLMLNAFDAMEDCPPENREARVQVASDGEGQIAISVRDRGSGLTDEKLGRIFEPFYTTKRNGLGMGLSISRSIIEAHGGKLWAENNADGAGATFYLTLPPETRKKADDGIVDYWADLLRNGK